MIKKACFVTKKKRLIEKTKKILSKKFQFFLKDYRSRKPSLEIVYYVKNLKKRNFIAIVSIELHTA